MTAQIFQQGQLNNSNHGVMHEELQASLVHPQPEQN